MRALPPFRLAEGADHDAAVVRGGRFAGVAGVDLAEWGAPKLWATPLMINQWSVQKSGINTATLTSVGCTAPTINTPGAVAASDDSATLSGVRFSTTTVNATVAGLVSTHDMSTRSRPMIGFSFMPGGEVTGVRYWVGLFGGTSPTGTDTPAAGVAAFRFSTALDTRWRCFTDAGGSLTEPTLISTPHAPIVGVRQNLFIRVLDNGNIEFWGSTGRYENGGPLTLFARASSDLPSDSAAMMYVCAVTKTGGAVAKTISISRVAGSWS